MKVNVIIPRRIPSTVTRRISLLAIAMGALAIDEPLCCVRKDLKKPDAYAVEETANFVALVRKHYPDVRIGDIEPYPFLQREELLAFLDASSVAVPESEDWTFTRFVRDFSQRFARRKR